MAPWQSPAGIGGPFHLHHQLPTPCSPLRSPSLVSPFHSADTPTSPSLQPPTTPTTSSATSPVKTSVKRTRRKRCGVCTGCRRTENCGRCVVCTNPNSTNTVCKQRRCEFLLQRPSAQVSSVVTTVYCIISGFVPKELEHLNNSTSINIQLCPSATNLSIYHTLILSILAIRGSPSGIGIPNIIYLN